MFILCMFTKKSIYFGIERLWIDTLYNFFWKLDAINLIYENRNVDIESTMVDHSLKVKTRPHAPTGRLIKVWIKCDLLVLKWLNIFTIYRNFQCRFLFLTNVRRLFCIDLIIKDDALLREILGNDEMSSRKHCRVRLKVDLITSGIRQSSVETFFNAFALQYSPPAAVRRRHTISEGIFWWT